MKHSSDFLCSGSGRAACPALPVFVCSSTHSAGQRCELASIEAFKSDPAPSGPRCRTFSGIARSGTPLRDSRATPHSGSGRLQAVGEAGSRPASLLLDPASSLGIWVVSGGEGFEPSRDQTAPSDFRDRTHLAQPCGLRSGARHNARQFASNGPLAGPRPFPASRHHAHDYAAEGPRQVGPAAGRLVASARRRPGSAGGQGLQSRRAERCVPAGA